jgi:hypothetical protein
MIEYPSAGHTICDTPVIDKLRAQTLIDITEILLNRMIQDQQSRWIISLEKNGINKTKIVLSGIFEFLDKEKSIKIHELCTELQKKFNVCISLAISSFKIVISMSLQLGDTLRLNDVEAADIISMTHKAGKKVDFAKSLIILHPDYVDLPFTIVA